MTGHRSVFPSQILKMKKSDLLNVQMGEDIDHTTVDISDENKIKFFKLQKKILLRGRKRKQEPKD